VGKKGRPSKGNGKVVAIIPAAGAGVRMGAGKAKQFLEIKGKPILALTLEKFQACPAIHAIIAVVPPKLVDFCRKEIVEKYKLTKVSHVVPGGRRRQDSVRLGIEASRGLYSTVLIHDGVRPFIEQSLISKAISAAGRHRAVIAAMPARETVKEVDESGLVVKTHDRRWVWSVQTPQVFRYKDIHKAHQKAVEEGWEDLTDDALLMEKMGIAVKVIEGSEQNIKITTSKDLELAEYILQMRNKA
jgi:2-C-methyl-D-erythritol 4-phosphate cytidylyltransferase